MLATKFSVFRFADVRVREREFAIVKAGHVQQVEPKAFRVLLMLIRNPNKLISKEELLASVWGYTSVTENSLTRNIALLRRLLGDDPREPRFIETVSGIGYRFVCPVEVCEDGSGDSGVAEQPLTGRPSGEASVSPKAEEAAPSRSKDYRWKWVTAGAVGMAAVMGTGYWYLRRPLPPPRITSYTQLTHDGREKFPAGTDGNRVYFTWNFDAPIAEVPIAQVATTGGEIAAVSVGLKDVQLMEDISPDGSSLIIATSVLGAVPTDRPQWNVSVPGGSLHRLPDGHGAAFSPDGKSVVYGTYDGGIWLVRSDGTGAHKLASAEGSAGGFAWSPDGKTIRLDHAGSLWELASSGSNLHQLLTGWRPGEGKCCGRWTADGKFFLFQSGSAQIWALDERRSMLRKPAEPVQLTEGPIRWNWLVPGKDPKKVYAEGITPHGELSRYDAQAKAFRPFLGGISAGCVAFSKDGKFVAYVLYPEGTLWKANRDGSNPVRLSDPPISAHDPRWSPDGKQIDFSDLAHKPYVIYTVSTEGGSPRRLLPDDTGEEVDPTWSPDGRRIVFNWRRPGDELRILDLEDNQVMTVPGSSGVWSPRWSPDGRYIAGITETYGLKVFDMKTNQWSTLTERPVGYPAWSKDSRWIYFVADRANAVARIPVTGGKEERVADLKDWTFTGWWHWMDLDPTDAPLMLRDAGSEDIYALTMEVK